MQGVSKRDEWAAYRHTTDTSASGPTMQSVIEQNDLSELMNMVGSFKSRAVPAAAAAPHCAVRNVPFATFRSLTISSVPIIPVWALQADLAGRGFAGERGEAVVISSTVSGTPLTPVLGMQADLAGRDFVGERGEAVVISTGAQAAPDAERSAAERAAAQARHAAHLRVPRRPPWSRQMTADAVHAQEQAAFLEWRRQLARCAAQCFGRPWQHTQSCSGAASSHGALSTVLGSGPHSALARTDCALALTAWRAAGWRSRRGSS